jgi:hypothetical protein
MECPVQNDVGSVYTIFGGDFRRGNPLRLRVGIFDRMGEGKLGCDAPTTAVVHRENVVAVWTKRLRKVKILLLIREAVIEDYCRVRPGAARKVECAE